MKVNEILWESVPFRKCGHLSSTSVVLAIMTTFSDSYSMLSLSQF